jgi:hypothetical protein
MFGISPMEDDILSKGYIKCNSSWAILSRKKRLSRGFIFAPPGTYRKKER